MFRFIRQARGLIRPYRFGPYRTFVDSITTQGDLVSPKYSQLARTLSVWSPADAVSFNSFQSFEISTNATNNRSITKNSPINYDGIVKMHLEQDSYMESLKSSYLALFAVMERHFSHNATSTNIDEFREFLDVYTNAIVHPEREESKAFAAWAATNSIYFNKDISSMSEDEKKEHARRLREAAKNKKASSEPSEGGNGGNGGAGGGSGNSGSGNKNGGNHNIRPPSPKWPYFLAVLALVIYPFATGKVSEYMNPNSNIGARYFELADYFNELLHLDDNLTDEEKAERKARREARSLENINLIPVFPDDPIYGNVPPGATPPPLLVIDVGTLGYYDKSNEYTSVFKPRNGATKLIRTLSPHYEIALVSEKDILQASPLFDVVDPENRCFRVGKELYRGTILDNLHRFRRNKDRIIVVHSAPRSKTDSIDSSIIVPYLVEGGRDDDIEKLIPFLMNLSVTDVRNFKSAFESLGTNIAREVARRFNDRLANKAAEERMIRNKGLGGVLRSNMNELSNENTAFKRTETGTKKKGALFNWIESAEKEKEMAEMQRREKMNELYAKKMQEKAREG